MIAALARLNPSPAAASPAPGAGLNPPASPLAFPASGLGAPAPNSVSPFSQARGESDRAFEAFRAYLELGPARRYAAVAGKVGASLRTVKRWAGDFDWPARIKAYSAGSALSFAETERTVQREQVLGATARARAFHDRQYALADALLAAAERYLQNLGGGDPDQMTFADACKAVELASRLRQQAEHRAGDDPAGGAQTLRDQLATLLDQACRETPSATAAPVPPRSPAFPETKAHVA